MIIENLVNYQIKIMVVDDSKSSSEIITFMLEKLNFTVINAKNGQEALTLLNNNQDTQIVLTDYAMPDMDGVQLTYRIRQNYSKEKLAIIGISGLNDEMLSANFIKNGANDFLIKPFWIFGIDRTVQNMIGTEQYGLYYALFNFSFLFNIFLDLGITNFNNRNISQNSFLQA